MRDIRLFRLTTDGVKEPNGYKVTGYYRKITSKLDGT